MKYITGLFAGLLCAIATGCAAQTNEVMPATLSSSQQEAFDRVAKQLDNPCAEERLAGYDSLYDVIHAGEKCHESWLVSETISFFIGAGYGAEDVYPIAVEELEGLMEPVEFNTADRPKKGHDEAPVQIVIFSDFQCPYCSRGASTLERVSADHKDDAQIVFKHYPLISIHPEALSAAMIAVFAQTKGKFWEVHDTLFSNQKELSPSYLIKILEKDLGANVEDVFEPEAGHAYSLVVAEDMDEATAVGVHGTPTFFVNGVRVEGGISYKRLDSRIEAEKKAPARASKEAQAKARARILAKNPYRETEIKNIYALLDDAGKKRLKSIARNLPCPCVELSDEPLHSCINAENVCSEAKEIMGRLGQRIAENAADAELLAEIREVYKRILSKQ